MSTSPGDALAEVIRAEYPRILATLIRVTGDVNLAEDALQDAVVRALQTWPRDGLPLSPKAWLTTAARRCAIDRIRREAMRTGKEAAAVFVFDSDGPEPPDSVVQDDLLRLVFTCCHPALATDTQVALSLRTLAGLTTTEVSRALLVPEPTMAKRLTRAKQKIAHAGIPYRVPTDSELPDRLPAVAATVYLIFNEGYASVGAEPIRAGLVGEAIRLGRLLLELMPDEASVRGLLALMLLQDSRRLARVASDGSLTVLAEQDRSRWDRNQIDEGVVLVGSALARSPERPDPYVVQAAVAACHAIAPRYEDTDWAAVVSWYDVLLTVSDNPIVRLNRAAALAELAGPTVSLSEIDRITGLESYPWWHAARGELLLRLGRFDESAAAADRASGLGLSEPHLAHLRRRLAAGVAPGVEPGVLPGS